MSSGPGYGMPAWSAGSLRASDADRERAVEVLKTGFSEGRLPKDDYDARLHHAYTAPTRFDLEQVTAQLPGGGPGLFAPPAKPRTNSLAIASLACGAGQLIAWPLSTVPAVVLGHVARKQIRRTGEDGAGLALAGLVLGWVGVGVIVAAVVFITLAIVVFTRSSGASTG
jgi:uncharacterized membrane protein